VESLGGVRPEIVEAIDAAMGHCLEETQLNLAGVEGHSYQVQCLLLSQEVCYFTKRKSLLISKEDS
jgi:hypothetical protein